MNRDETLQWLRNRVPLYTDSTEYEGMSLSFVADMDGREDQQTNTEAVLPRQHKRGEC